MIKPHKEILEFIGSGNAFNTKLDNNCAYIKKGNTLFLIDCGSTIFKKIQKYDILAGVNNIIVLITHTHPDHSASLGDLIFYTYYVLHIKLTCIYPDKEYMVRFLGFMGVDEKIYNIKQLKADDIVYNEDISFKIETYPEIHVEQLHSYGYIIIVDEKKIYYSGDSNNIDDIILKKFYDNEIDYFYQDTCQNDFPGNPHLAIEKLSNYIKPELRHKIYCMHIDKDFNRDAAIKLGFNVASNKFF
jgi:ribonuclease BN (tRNA processing enzyme)